MPRRTTANGLLRDAKVFTVEGGGPFPVDMLRYDHCWPYREAEDSHAMPGRWGTPRRRIALQTYHPNSPTERRWQSFGWKLIGEGIHDAKEGM